MNMCGAGWRRGESNPCPVESERQFVTCFSGLLLERVRPADSTFNVEGLVTDRPTDSVFVRVITPLPVTQTSYWRDVPQAAARRASTGAFVGKGTTLFAVVFDGLWSAAIIRCMH